MREIGIFRGKRVDTEKWVEGYYLRLNGTEETETLHLIIDEKGEYHRVNPETVGEWTGLKDRNGTKIFEGDDIRFTFTGVECFIRWTNYAAMFEAVSEKNKMDLNHICTRDFVVIGNLHDNPKGYKEGKAND